MHTVRGLVSLLQFVDCCCYVEFSASVKFVVQSVVECPKSPDKSSTSSAAASHRLQPILQHDMWPTVQQ